MEPKIVVIGRTLNEAQNIERFCTNYGFADTILITDGGSTDDTVSKALQFDNVEVKDVSYLRMRTTAGVFTPEGAQTNILIEWAKEEGADWIIRDDIDCWPNSVLRARAREIFSTEEQPSIFAYRLYLWGENQYFPKYNEPGQSLWAWRPDKVNIYCDESNPFAQGVTGLPDDDQRHNLEPPLVLLHYFCPDEATVQRKMVFYEAQGFSYTHPLHSIYAPPEPLPDWAF